MSEARPEDFRRDSGIPCPCCSARLHSFEMLGIHYARHTPEEKEAAWAKVPAFFAERNKTYTLTLMKTPWDKFEVPNVNSVIRFDQS